MPDISSLHALGIYPWVRKTVTNAATEGAATSLQARVATCTACTLSSTRTQTVLGGGNPQARLMIIGEAPGFYEDQQGEPFIGNAGMLLTNILQAFGWTRNDVYITNILKCRPPNNRDPLPDEIANCTPFLIEQINAVKPSILLALGKIAANYLLNTNASLDELRQTVHLHHPTNTPLYVSYHPAYLLRAPGDKKKAYADWVAIKRATDSVSKC